MRQRFKAGRVVGLLLEVFAEASAECVPTPAFGKIGLRVKWRYHQAAGQPIPSCPVLLLLGVIVRAAGSRQIQPRSRYLDVQNWKCCPSFYLLGDGMIFQTASICPRPSESGFGGIGAFVQATVRCGWILRRVGLYADRAEVPFGKLLGLPFMRLSGSRADCLPRMV